jgi:hypothetical protein
MARTSDFLRKDDVLDPDQRPAPGDEVDYDGTDGRMRSSVWAVVAIIGMVTLAVLQPHARNFSPADGHSAAPVAAVYPH